MIREKTIIDYNKLFYDISIKLNRINQSQRFLCEKIGLSRTILFRLQRSQKIEMDSFIKLIDWLNASASDYIYRVTIKTKKGILTQIETEKEKIKSYNKNIGILKYNLERKKTHKTKQKLNNYIIEKRLSESKIEILQRYLNQ